jgi:hypothetical protein
MMMGTLRYLFILAVTAAQLAAVPVSEGYIRTVHLGFEVWLKGPDFEFFGASDGGNAEAIAACASCPPGTLIPMGAEIFQMFGRGSYQGVLYPQLYLYSIDPPLQITADPILATGPGSYSSTFSISGVVTAEPSILGPRLFDLPLSGSGSTRLTLGEGNVGLFFIQAEYHFIPEPSTMALLGIGSIALICAKRRLKARAPKVRST